VQKYFMWIPTFAAVQSLTKRQVLLVCHSGLDPWFDRPLDRLAVLGDVEGLTTLSRVEGESSAFSRTSVSGCRIRHPGPDPGPA
jgi:hypothetical protein